MFGYDFFYLREEDSLRGQLFTCIKLERLKKCLESWLKLDYPSDANDEHHHQQQFSIVSCYPESNGDATFEQGLQYGYQLGRGGGDGCDGQSRQRRRRRNRFHIHVSTRSHWTRTEQWPIDQFYGNVIGIDDDDAAGQEGSVGARRTGPSRLAFGANVVECGDGDAAVGTTTVDGGGALLRSTFERRHGEVSRFFVLLFFFSFSLPNSFFFFARRRVWQREIRSDSTVISLTLRDALNYRVEANATIICHQDDPQLKVRARLFFSKSTGTT